MKMPSFFQVLLVAAVLPAFPAAGWGQDLHIYYNVFNDSVRFELNGKPVAKPKVKRGGVVHVHLLEYNPYLYSATLTVDHNPDALVNSGMAENATADIASNMTGSSPIMSIFGALNSSVFSMPVFKMGDQKMTLANFMGNARGAEEQMLQETESLLEETAQTETSLKAVAKDLQTLSRSLTIAAVMETRINEIQYNPQFSPSQIKQYVREFYTAMFGAGRVDSLSLLSALDYGQTAISLRQKTAEWSRLTKRYRQQLSKLQGAMSAFESMGINDPAFRTKRNAIEDQVGVAADNAAGLDSVAVASERLLARAQAVKPESLTVLYLRFQEIMNNPFSFHDYFFVGGDNISVKVEVLRRDSTRQGVGDPKDFLVKTRSFRVEGYGGLKISAAAGVNFAQFFNQPMRYSSRDGAIVEEADDRFRPAVTSQLLFFANRGGRTSFGGAFGVGLPILSGEESAMFFLGPSVIFGSGKRLVLTTGVLGGKIQRLAKGFKPGDAFDPAAGDIPMASRYEYGYFLGLSFNLAGN